jgi:hypothetical protein
MCRCAVVTAARIMVETDVDVTAAFACYNGTAPTVRSLVTSCDRPPAPGTAAQPRFAHHGITTLAGDTAMRLPTQTAGKSHTARGF